MPLGLSIYHSAGEFCPRIQYDAKSGRMAKVDLTADGNAVIKADITMQQPAFAFDIGSIQIGWANFETGAVPSIIMVPFGQPMPARPDRAHKAGFRARVWDGIEGHTREFSATAGATVNVIEALWDEWMGTPAAAAGQIPVIRLVDVMPVGSARRTNYAPVFQLLQWIDRPERLFGPRTVPAPGQPPITPPAAAQPMLQQVQAAAWQGATAAPTPRWGEAA